ncbi:MAG TPA: hypothetical protein DIT64_05405 [Verrucomicrobiales bacterium]|nr:hypothetical protein [Verrucomicrobiales bacterium]
MHDAGHPQRKPQPGGAFLDAARTRGACHPQAERVVALFVPVGSLDGETGGRTRRRENGALPRHAVGDACDAAISRPQRHALHEGLHRSADAVELHL